MIFFSLYSIGKWWWNFGGHFLIFPSKQLYLQNTIAIVASIDIQTHTHTHTRHSINRSFIIIKSKQVRFFDGGLREFEGKKRTLFKYLLFFFLVFYIPWKLCILKSLLVLLFYIICFLSLRFLLIAPGGWWWHLNDNTHTHTHTFTKTRGENP